MDPQFHAHRVGPVGIEVQKAFLAPAVGRSGPNTFFIDQLVLNQSRPDLGSRAAFQACETGDGHPRNRLSFAHYVENQNFVCVAQRLMRSPASPMNIDLFYRHISLSSIALPPSK